MSTTPPPDALRETWESVEQKSLDLAKTIQDYCTQTGERFDAMLVIPRGSYYPANIVSRCLGFGATDLLHACVGSYDHGATERNKQFELGQMPLPEQVRGKNILIIEEVCDTGHTLAFLADWLKQQGAGTIKTGVLHYKPDRSQTDFVPDWFQQQTDKWIVYPWETFEEQGKQASVLKTS